MIGLACSALAAASAWLVARRDARHEHVNYALWAAVWHSGAVSLDRCLRPGDRSPRAALTLWTIIALYSGLAYMRAWRWDAGTALGFAVTLFGLFAGGCLSPDRWWRIATWGPFVASSAIGLWALGAWLDPFIASVDGEPGLWWRDREWTFTQRIALILLVSDLCMLAFIPWPGVQVWQGRVSAIVVAGMQLNWWWKNRRNDDRNVAGQD